jgi:hypothetical protein
VAAAVKKAKRGGKRENSGRKPGSLNKRTREKQAEFAASGKKDPLDSQLDLHEWALKEFKRACKDLAAFEKDHGKALSNARLCVDPTDEQVMLMAEHKRLGGEIDRFSGKIHAYAIGATPFLHARLAATDSKVSVSTHEQALDELDDDENGSRASEGDDD